MCLSEEQPVFLGNCIYCGARVYRKTDGEVTSIRSAPDCPCSVKEEKNDN